MRRNSPSTRSRSSRPGRAATSCSVCWAAEKLGLSGDAATAYSKEVVAADFEEAGDQDVQNKVVKDFAAKGVAITAAEVRAKMDELMAAAVAQVKAGT